MARHTAKSHKIRKVEILVIQTLISASTSPSTQTCWIGIMDPHNNVRYVEGKGALAHAFTVSETGKYRAFVQNRGTKNVTAAGGYYFE